MKSPRILVIRRDNIGDLVCTTPLISAIRKHYGNAWIGVLANSYNAPVLENNADIDELYAYRKAKHGGMNAFKTLYERGALIARLRRQALDYAIVATPAHRDRGLRIARLAGARQVVAFARGGAPSPGIDVPVAIENAPAAHEVELVWRIAAALGIEGAPPAARVIASPDIVAAVRESITERSWTAAGPLIGVHLSARVPSQRWPATRFAALMRELHVRRQARFIMFWAPGDATNPQHPGDDAKARQVEGATSDLPVLPWPTHELRQLIGGMASCERMILADGGAMHIAAALGKPIVALFGDSDARRWRPWGVPCEVSQAHSRDVADIAVEEVLAAYDRLSSRVTSLS